MDDEDYSPPTFDEIWQHANDATLSAMMRAQAWDHLSHIRYHDENYGESIAYAEMAEKLYREAGWTEQEGDAAYFQGQGHAMLNQEEKSIEAFARASDRFREVGNERYLADAIRGMALGNKWLEQTDEALILFESAANFYETNESWWMAGDCHMEAGEIRGSCGHSEDALGEFSKARALYEKQNAVQMSGRAADRMASALIELGRFSEALDLLRENVDLAVYTEDVEAVAWAQYRLGWTLNYVDEFREAMHWLDLSRRFYAENGRIRNKADVDIQRHFALRHLGSKAEADQVARGLRAYWHSVANFDRLVIHDSNTALEFMGEQNIPEAIRLAKKAASVAAKHCRDWEQRVTRLILAEIYVGAGEVNEALNALESDMAEQWGDSLLYKSRHLLVLAEIAKSEGRPHESRGITERVIELAETANYTSILGSAHANLADLADAEGDEGRGREMRSQAVALFLASGDVPSANEHARKILPGAAERRRVDEWQAIANSDLEPELPRSQVNRSPRRMPSSREIEESRSTAPLLSPPEKKTPKDASKDDSPEPPADTDAPATDESSADESSTDE